MGDELATSNVNRSYSLSATSIAIFTFTLLFLYPMFARGEIDALPFQATLVVRVCAPADPEPRQKTAAETTASLAMRILQYATPGP
jgi:hypothetical protein